MAQEGSNIFSWLLIGVGGYLIWNWWSSSQATALPSSTTTPGLPAGTVTQPTSLTNNAINANSGTSVTAPSAPPVTANLSAPLSNVAVTVMTQGLQKLYPSGIPASFTGYQWDYYKTMFLGPQITLSQTGLSGSGNYSLQQYMQAYLNVLANQSLPANAGTAGLGCMTCGSPNCSGCSGMGSVSNTDLLYHKMISRKGWAVGDFADTRANKTESSYVN